MLHLTDNPYYFADLFYTAWDILQAAAGAIRHGHIDVHILNELL